MLEQHELHVGSSRRYLAKIEAQIGTADQDLCRLRATIHMAEEMAA
jgi:hypothetical protein